MISTRTTCAHCETETVVEVPDEETAIIGKTRELHAYSDAWEISTCTECKQRFGVKYG